MLRGLATLLFANALACSALSDLVTFNASGIAPGNPDSDQAAQTAYLDRLRGDGYASFYEGFQGAGWEGARSTIVGGSHVAASVVSQGITWRSSDGDFITTSDANDGASPWHLYAKGGSPQETLHAVPARIIGESTSILYGMGFWVSGGPPGKGKLNLILDDTTLLKFERVIGFDDNVPPEPIKETSRLTSAKQFYGVIAPDGFTKFELREVEGVLQDQVLMWGADFTFAAIPEADPFILTGGGLLGFALLRCSRRRRD